MTVGSGWSVQRAAKAGDGFVLTAPGRVTKLRAPSEQEEQEVRGRKWVQKDEDYFLAPGTLFSKV